MAYTVGRLAKRFGLSRSTLLYYHRLGLLVPRDRAEGEYRFYGPDQVSRLERIVRYRKAGVPLQEIIPLLEEDTGGGADSPPDPIRAALTRRLEQLDQDMAALQAQRDFVRTLLGAAGTPIQEGESDPAMGKARWTALLRSAGFSDRDMHRWHRQFERTAPLEHDRFLRYLCIPANEIRAIREWSRNAED